MTAVVGRVWSWMSPSNFLYLPWGNKVKPEKTIEGKESDGQTKRRWGLLGLTSWVWSGQKNQSELTPTEEFWEAEETYRPLEIEDVSAEETEVDVPQKAPRWWRRLMPTSAFFFWPRSSGAKGLRQRKCAGWRDESWDSDSNKDGEISDYGTPPPSPTPNLSTKFSPFQALAQTWTGEILPEHYEICFNFLRHLFDLFVVGFLWTVSPPTKFILDVLGVQGALKLWLHGMAMFFVSSIGMAGLLWLVQEYLPQFALVYGIIQALVISVSVKQSVILGTGEEEEEEKEEEKMEEDEDVFEKNETSNGTKGKRGL